MADSLQRFAKELANPQRNPERLRRYWGRINDLAPTVGHLLSTSEAIQEASLWWGDCIQPKGGFLNEGPAHEYVETIDDRQIRRALEWAYAGICETLYMDGVRPEGPFDLLYFYKLLGGLSSHPVHRGEDARASLDRGLRAGSFNRDQKAQSLTS